MLKNLRFTKVYNEVITDKNLNATELRVYLILWMYDINGNGVVDTVSYVKLGEDANLSSCRARQVVSSLVKKGYVIKSNEYIGKTNTRNTYTLPNKIIADTKSRLIKLANKTNKEALSNNNDIPLESNGEKSSTSSDNSFTESSDNPLSIYTKDNTDDDIEKEITKLKQKEGEEVVSKALAKMGKYTINKKGFIAYLIKTIDSIKKYTYSKINTYVHKNYSKKQPSTFNNFKQRNYNFKELKMQLLGWSNADYSDCLVE